MTPTHSKVLGLYEISPVAQDGIRALAGSPVLQQHPSAASIESWSCPGAKEEQQQVCGVHTHTGTPCARASGAETFDKNKVKGKYT